MAANVSLNKRFESPFSLWLHNTKCVLEGKVKIDVRGTWPVASIGNISEKVETHEDFVWFIIQSLDIKRGA